jgi:hypothetical protein
MSIQKLFTQDLGYRAVLALCASALLATGCNVIPAPSADTTRYYVLSAPSVGATGAQPINGGLRIGLRNVELAPYLKKGSLVVRTGENELSFPSEARWAEPLEQVILHSLRAQILASPTVGRVFVQPFPFEEPRDFDVSVRLIRCEGVLPPGGGSGVVQLVAMIEVMRIGALGEVVSRRRFAAPETAWDGKDFSQLAARLSAAVAALSEDVAGVLPAKL